MSEGNETADDAAAQEEETDAAVQEGDAADTTEPTAEEADADEQSVKCKLIINPADSQLPLLYTEGNAWCIVSVIECETCHTGT